MLVRIKFEGKSRKIDGSVKTIQALREQISKLFGPEAQNLNIVYKDCDDELVNVFDDDDIINCFSEAQDLKLSNVTFILKQKQVAARSMSSKSVSRSPVSKSGSSSSDSEVQQPAPLPLIAQSSTNTEATAATKAKPIEMTPEEYKSKIEIEKAELKKKIEEEYKKKMELADIKAQEKVKMMEKKRELKEFKEKVTPLKLANQEAMKATLLRFRFMNQGALSRGNPAPSVAFNEIVKEAFASCPGLGTSPELLNIVLAQSKAQIVNVLKSAYAQAAASNPQLVSEGLERVKEFETFCNPADGSVEPLVPIMHGRAKHCRKRSLSGSDEGSTEKHIGHRHGPKHHYGLEHMSHRARHHQGEDHHSHHGHKPHAEERAERARIREERRAQKDSERAEHDTSKAAERELKDKVRALKDQFPKMDKKELKQIVMQNASVAIGHLTDLVKAYKRTKSSAGK